MSMLEETYKNATVNFRESLYLHTYITVVFMLFFVVSMMYTTVVGKFAAFGFAFLLMWLTSSFIFSKRNLIFSPQLKTMRSKALIHLVAGNAPMAIFVGLALTL